MADWKAIKKDYESGIGYKDLALKYGVKATTIRVHRSRGKWQVDPEIAKELEKQAAKDDVTDVTPKPKSVTEKRNAVTKKNVTDKVTSNETLNDKQKRFVLLYLQYYNATKAYQEAFGCSYETARTNGSALLAKTNVKRLLEECKEEMANTMVANAQDVINDMLKLSRTDISDYVTIDIQKVYSKGQKNADGTKHYYYTVDVIPKDFNTIDTSGIKSISSGRDGFKLDMYDKTSMLKELVKILPEQKTDTKSDPLIQAIRKSVKNGKDEIDESEIEE